MGDLNIHDLRQFVGCSSFVELGTGRRNGINCALRYPFRQYHSVEKCRSLFVDAAKDNEHDALTFWYGDSRQVLRQLLPLPGKVLFWVDSHFGNGADFGLGEYKFDEDNLPLKQELEIIAELQPSCSLLIDDADMLYGGTFELPGAQAKLPPSYVPPGVEWLEKLFPHLHLRVDRRHQGFVILCA